MKTSLICLLAGLFLTLSTNVTIADWVLIQDFEGATYADFDLHKRYPPQGELFLFGADPDDFSNGHYYANPGDPQLDGSSNQIWNSMTLPTPVVEGATATIKYDLYFFTAGPHNLNIGLSAIEVAIDDTLSKEDGQLLQPITYDAFESQAAWTVGNFQFRDAGEFAYADDLYPIGEWFTMYCVIDNSADRTYFYYKTTSMTVPVHVPLPESDFALFRNGTTDPLVTWIITSAGTRLSDDGIAGIFLVDNLYIDNAGVNLDGGAHVGPGGNTLWGGFTINTETGNVNTGDWLGLLNVSTEPWAYSYDLEAFVYMPEAHVSEAGAWAYVPK
jgi:hypothetical protein